MSLRLRRIESGLYEEPGGRYRVERVDSLGESWSRLHQQFIETTSSVWTVTKAPKTPNGEWVEILERATKRQCVVALEELLNTEGKRS